MLIYNNNDALDVKHPFHLSKSKVNHVRTLYKDNYGGVWIGGVEGLEYYNTKTSQKKQIINKSLYPDLGTWSVYALEPFKNNILWVGLYNRIARISLTDFSITFFDLAKAVKDRSVMSILVVDNHKLWLGTEGYGIVQLKIDDKLRVYNDVLSNSFRSVSSVKEKLSESNIYSLYKDYQNAVWIGTSQGLYKADLNSNPIQIENIQLNTADINNYISAITGDDKNVWVAHTDGMTKINTYSGEILNYQNRDKFGGWHFLERAFYRDTIANEICFGAKNGYISFNPSQIKKVENKKLVLKIISRR